MGGGSERDDDEVVWRSTVPLGADLTREEGEDVETGGLEAVGVGAKRSLKPEAWRWI